MPYSDVCGKYFKCARALQAAEVGYECLVHLTAPPVRIPAVRLDQNSVVCSTFQVISHSHMLRILSKGDFCLLQVYVSFRFVLILLYCSYDGQWDCHDGSAVLAVPEWITNMGLVLIPILSIYDNFVQHVL